jgi:Mg2+-importing ATPase
MRTWVDAWLAWLLGAAMLGALIAAAFHYSEERAFVHLAERAEPWWLLVAVLLQTGTYVAQGAIWRRVTGRAGARLSSWAAFELGLAKLFADQTLPSVGVSSSLLVARALDQRRLPQPSARAAVLVNIASYHLAYVIALAPALAIIVGKGTSASVTGTAIAILLFPRAASSRCVQP